MPRDQKQSNHLWREAERTAEAHGYIARTSWHDSSDGTITGLFSTRGGRTTVGKVVIRGGELVAVEGVMKQLLRP